MKKLFIFLFVLSFIFLANCCNNSVEPYQKTHWEGGIEPIPADSLNKIESKNLN